MVFLISYMAATVNLTLSLANIMYIKVCLLLVRQGFAWQHILLYFDLMLLCWILVNITRTIVILGTL